ncbi:hypothetical protein PGTUg99_035462 [Puccinia graminis f. sp. tritici]|uniref:Uncharacterized protein n=1 Tax=Puccinia graminis f. sp. tritici TaxID=56615 RepID=A0A5B0N3T8_PUCGR|nr:hypothetical protein PGTUg99_035462 [Puccinia graminis f. sp. tritici]
MKFGVGAPNIPKESDSDQSERSKPEKLPDNFESPEGSPTRFTPSLSKMANNNGDPALQALQQQLSEMKAGFEAIVQQQNQTIANLTNIATAHQQQLQNPPAQSHSDLMLRQFIKDPETPFIADKDYTNFDALTVVENKKVTELLQNTLHNDLLTIVESEGMTCLKELFKLLRSKCKQLGR